MARLKSFFWQTNNTIHSFIKFIIICQTHYPSPFHAYSHAFHSLSERSNLVSFLKRTIEDKIRLLVFNISYSRHARSRTHLQAFLVALGFRQSGFTNLLSTKELYAFFSHKHCYCSPFRSTRYPSWWVGVNWNVLNWLPDNPSSRLIEVRISEILLYMQQMSMKDSLLALVFLCIFSCFFLFSSCVSLVLFIFLLAYLCLVSSVLFSTPSLPERKFCRNFTL